MLIAGIAVTSSLISFQAHAAVSEKTVVIGEIAWAGSSLSTADEWLELWNVSDVPVALAGWSLRGASDTPLLFPASSTIPAHGAYLISNYDASDAKSVLATTTQFVTTVVSLSNAALKIELLDEAGVVMDTAGTGDTPLAGASLPIKTSMIRKDVMLDGATTTAWTDAAATENLKPGIADLGTPGICDGCQVTTTITESSPEPTTETASTTPTVDETTTTSTEASAISTGTTETIEETLAEVVTASITIETTEIATTTEATTTTSITFPENAPQTVQTSEPIPPPLPTAPTILHNHLVRLNEIAPYPSSGKEWIEVVTLDAAQVMNLQGYMLHDAAGRILTIGSVTIDPVSRHAAVFLPTARLNNGGDSVSLYAPDGVLLDTMSYGVTHKGETWIRFPDATGDWQKTLTPTQNIPNALTVQPAEPDPPVAVPIQQPKQQTIPVHKMETVSFVTLADPVTKSATPKKEPVDQKTKTKKPASQAVKKSTKTKKYPSVKPIRPITFDMLTQDNLTEVRVRLTGRVGSFPGLTPRHTFVLQNPDGRGLLVTISTKQRLPVFGNDVAVIGSLRIDDKGTASLKMSTRDMWSSQATSSWTVHPRIVDLLAPAAEDAWSLITVTGTVTSVKTSTVHLDLEDAEVDVVIKPLIRYRPKRLLPGDVVAVTGILDLTSPTPRLMPRVAEDITLIRHAALKNTSAISDAKPQGPILPGWTPLGAAGGAFAVTEGAKRLHRRRKMRALEKKL